MNYPIWYLPGIGGGLLIALIAVSHVFISHFAVGGGLYLVLTERKGLRENSQEILDFTKRHAKFFMLLTMVFGGITGVGIWFIISLVHPAATSLLIHTFVYGWAAEWVWFLVEIVALLVYYYTFGRMENRAHQAVGWIYFVAAWLSLFLINGIIDFMLTPGSWVENHHFWSGFFNPSFWPSLFFRTFLSFMLAGLYAFLTSTFQENPDFKARMTRYSGKWALFSFLLMLPCGYWYLSILPEPARILVGGSSPTIQAAIPYAIYAALVVFALILLLAIVRPAINNKPLALLALAAAFVLLGSFEWTREAARRPFVLNEVMYSQGVTVSQAEALQGQPFLAGAKWADVAKATEENLLEAGEELFRLQCYACHTIGGINNDIRPKTDAMDFPAMYSYLRNVIHKRPYMPPFLGDELEAAALAAFLVGGLHGKEVNMAALAEPVDRSQKIYDAHCVGCHGMDIVKEWAADLSPADIETGLQSLNTLNDMMENFAGTAEERQLLAGFIRAQASPAGSEGRSVYSRNCTGCHEAEVFLTWAGDKSREDVMAGLAEPGRLNAMMQGISLSEQEREALVEWALAEHRGGKQ